MHKKSLQTVSLLLLFILGILYSYFIQIEISSPKRDIRQQNSFSFTINSKIEQNINLHIATNDKLNSIRCNEKPNRFKYYSKGHDYKQQEEVRLKVIKGVNQCQLKTLRTSKLKPILKQKISFVDYLLLFLFLVLPIFHLLFKALIWLLNSIWSEKNV